VWKDGSHLFTHCALRGYFESMFYVRTSARFSIVSHKSYCGGLTRIKFRTKLCNYYCKLTPVSNSPPIFTYFQLPLISTLSTISAIYKKNNNLVYIKSIERVLNRLQNQPTG